LLNDHAFGLDNVLIYQNLVRFFFQFGKVFWPQALTIITQAAEVQKSVGSKILGEIALVTTHSSHELIKIGAKVVRHSRYLIFQDSRGDSQRKAVC
jgi:hypothetical protein